MTKSHVSILIAPLLLSAAMLSAPSAASAQTVQSVHTQPLKQRHRTKISGVSGKEARVGFSGNRGLLYGIAWKQKAGDPCWVQTRGSAYVNRALSNVSRASGCKAKTGLKAVELTHPSKTALRLVRGIQVCSNAKGDMVKGIRLWSTRLDLRTGALSNDGAPPVQTARANCKNWRKNKKRMCPTGQVATGLILQRRGYDVQGIGLECSKLVIKRSR